MTGRPTRVLLRPRDAKCNLVASKTTVLMAWNPLVLGLFQLVQPTAASRVRALSLGAPVGVG